MTSYDILTRLAELNKRKNDEYGCAYLRHGEAMMELFPRGLYLNTASDFARFAVFDIMLGKMLRYAHNFYEGHPDSLDDIAVYAAILQEMDGDASREPEEGRDVPGAHRAGPPTPQGGW